MYPIYAAIATGWVILAMIDNRDDQWSELPGTDRAGMDTERLFITFYLKPSVLNCLVCLY